MKTVCKKIISVVLALFLLVGSASLNCFSDVDFNILGVKASAATYSGTCGDNLTWSLDTETGELVISGTGDMTNYSFSSLVPWHVNCSLIKSVVISDSVTSIGVAAFYECAELTNVTIPNSVTIIGKYAFEGCTSLTSITIPDSVTSIDSGAFSGCTGLTSVVIPDSVTSIGNSAFGECESLTNVTIGNSVTSIGEFAFGYCDSLTSVTIPDSVTSIGVGAFYDCYSITSVTIPDSVTSIGYGAFGYCYSLTSITVDEGNESYSSENGVLFDKNKTTLIQYPIGNSRTTYTTPDSVTSIGDGAFGYCESLTSVTIGNSVKSIGESAFYRCESLTSVTIPDSVTSIGNSAFEECKSLTSVTIPDSVTSIGGYAFYGCYGLTSVTIPDSVTSIEYAAFGYCTSLTDVYYLGTQEQWNNISIGNGNENLTDNVVFVPQREEIISGTCGENLTWVLYADGELVISGTGDMADYPSYSAPWDSNALSIKSVIIEDDVTSIGSYVFCGCTNLTNIIIPDGVTSVGKGAFYYCKSLTSITIPDSVTSIGGSAFYNCKSLTSITIPNSVTSIGDYTFSDCTGLTNVTIPDSVTSIGGSAFKYCTSLTSVTIPDSVTSIGEGMFNGCTNLTSVTIPDSVTSIGSEAFSRCDSLTSIIIPDSVTYIGDFAFYACPILKEVVFRSNEQITFGEYVFEGTPNAMICCEENSWLHFYADTNDIRFCILDSNGNPAFEIKNDVLVSYRGSSDNVYLSSVTKIGYGAFENNGTIEKVEIASGVNRIYNNAFKNCSELKTAIIPQSVTSIGVTAFDGCDDVTIWCYAGSYADDYAQSHNIAVEYITLDIDKDVIYLTPDELMSVTYSLNTPLMGSVGVEWESTNKSIVTVDSTGAIKGVRAGTAVITATTKDGDLRDYCVVKVVGIEALSSVKIDYNSGIITGINSNTTSLDGLVGITDSSCNLNYTTLGTDSVVYVERDSEIVDAYTILIYGDVNGDGWYDGMDAMIVSCLANGMLTQDDVSEAVYMAADCNHDGVIDAFDVALLEQAGLLLANVDQSKPNDELVTDSAYIEYLDLIDQTPEIEAEDETEDIPEVDNDTPEQGTTQVSILDMIINFIKLIFEFILSFIPRTYA